MEYVKWSTSNGVCQMEYVKSSMSNDVCQIVFVKWGMSNEHRVYTLSDHMGKVVASHSAVASSSPAEVALIYTMNVALRRYCS